MPAAPPEPLDESRIVFAGCVIDGDEHEWQCPSCGEDYDAPRRNPADEWEFEPAVPETQDHLTATETGQLARDITLGVPTTVVLDTPNKRQTLRKLQDEIRGIAERGGIVETPE